MFRVGGAAPPAASRCSARTSLRTPSRGDPPRRAIRAQNAVHAHTDAETYRLVASPSVSESGRYKPGEAHQAGGGGGKECAARHERSNDWPQGGAAPITRIS